MFAILAFACASTGGVMPLDKKIDVIISSHPEEIAVAYTELDGSATLLRNSHVVMHAASTMKVPVMLALFDAISKGKLELDQPVPVHNEFHSIMDGSTFSLDSSEDGDPDLYAYVGKNLPLEELMRRMIVRSSNLATDILIEYVGAPKVMELMKALGANEIQVLRGVEDIKAYEAGRNNVTSAYDLMLVMKAIADHEAVSPQASDKMIEILAHQEFNDGIPAGLPPGIRVAHKTGTITRIHHDAAIVLPADSPPYVLVVMTRGFEKASDSDKVIAEISREVWESRKR